MRKSLLLTLFCLITLFSFAQKPILPAEVWPDDRGQHIQAHGGGIIKVGKLYYWYGEERRQGLDSPGSWT